MALPVKTVVYPKILSGKSNGRLPDRILVVNDSRSPSVTLIEPAATAWHALCLAARRANITLQATSAFDSYRSYERQEALFRSRYTTTYLAGRPYRVWNGVRWYQRPNTAVAAVPGTSNHGWGLAVDTGEQLDRDSATESLRAVAIDWLIQNEVRYGWSHEIQSEPWHVRYWAGDQIPTAVTEEIGMEQKQRDELLWNLGWVVQGLVACDDPIIIPPHEDGFGNDSIPNELLRVIKASGGSVSDAAVEKIVDSAEAAATAGAAAGIATVIDDLLRTLASAMASATQTLGASTDSPT